MGKGYVEAKAAVVAGLDGSGFAWKAGFEAGYRIAPNLTTFGTAYAMPGVLGAGAGLRWDW